jgi:uncharacterized protein
MVNKISHGNPKPYHVMVKPRGAICNLDCEYCYYLEKEQLYPQSSFQISIELLETYTRQYIEAQQSSEVTFSWQGGEPTLAGLPFYEKAVELQKKYSRPEQKVLNTFQTNGLHLDAEWSEFFKRNNFLVGLSLDGPAYIHDAYRLDKGGHPTFVRVIRALRLLQDHNVDFNILACIHAASVTHPLEIYRFLRDEAQVHFMQFIPVVTKKTTPYAITAQQYGNFMCTIFDEWVRRDVGQIYVQLFDVALAAWAGLPPGLCVFSETCGNALALEHNGDLYSCDHFVSPAYLLGNIQQHPLNVLVSSEKQLRFGQDKRDTLPRQCRECEVRFVCNGGCPKDRFLHTAEGEPGLNYLCSGYLTFFKHIASPMQFMASELRLNRAPANVMQWLALNPDRP